MPGPPAFWYSRNLSGVAQCLAPLGWFYGAAAAYRLATGARASAGAPVICVGNLVAGGAGKTPVVRDFVRRLTGAGRKPHVISRGYGGRLTSLRRIDPSTDTAAVVGDEALMLAADGPVWAGPDRVTAAREAVSQGADALVLDDGFQDAALHHDLALVVTDGQAGFGNGLVIPAGPLREPVSRGLKRADVVAVMGPDDCGVGDITRRSGPDGPAVWNAVVRPGDLPVPAGTRVLAFAGIGRPRKFFDTLKGAGLSVVEAKAFPDHHAFSTPELDALKQRAARRALKLVTTEKDWARLPVSRRDGIEVLTITLQWHDEAAIERRLAALFG